MSRSYSHNLEEEGFTFGNVIIEPDETLPEVSREDVDLHSELVIGVRLNVPVCSHPELTKDARMAIAMAQCGGIGILSERLNANDQADEVKRVKNTPASALACVDEEGRLRVAAQVGIGKGREERLHKLVEAGVDVVFLDVECGHAKSLALAVQATRDVYPESVLRIVAGNVQTFPGATMLVQAGADAVKAGMDTPVPGVGIPHLTSLRNCAKACKPPREVMEVISQGVGGIKSEWEIFQALAFGASVVMIGDRLLGGTDEAVDTSFPRIVRGKPVSHVLDGIVDALERAMCIAQSKDLPSLQRAPTLRVTRNGHQENIQGQVIDPARRPSKPNDVHRAGTPVMSVVPVPMAAMGQ